MTTTPWLALATSSGEPDDHDGLHPVRREALVAAVDAYVRGLIAVPRPAAEFATGRRVLDEMLDVLSALDGAGVAGGGGTGADDTDAGGATSTDDAGTGSEVTDGGEPAPRSLAVSTTAPEPDAVDDPRSDPSPSPDDDRGQRGPATAPTPHFPASAGVSSAEGRTRGTPTRATDRAAVQAVADEAWTTAVGLGCLNREARSPDGHPATLWQALHLLLFRLPRDAATDLRHRAAEAAGIAPDDRTGLLVPAWPGVCAAVDLDEPDPPAGSPVHNAASRVRKNATGPVWEQDEALLAALRTALVLVELAPGELRLPYRPRNCDTTSTLAKVGPGFLQQVDLKLCQRSQENRPDDVGAYVDVLELLLAVTAVPVPHRTSAWAANAEQAFNHVRRSLGEGRDTVEHLPSTADLTWVEKPENAFKISKPPWAEPGELLWMLKPPVRRADGRIDPLGAGIYART